MFPQRNRGFSLIELLLVLSLASVAAVKGYHVVERGLERRMLDHTVATLRVLAHRAKLFQRADGEQRWPQTPAVLANNLSATSALRLRSGFGASVQFSAIPATDERPAWLKIETELPTEHHARYVATRLGYDARHEGNKLSWAQAPLRERLLHWHGDSVLDAHIDLQGHGINGLRSINSERLGRYSLPLSIIKVDRAIVRTLAIRYIGWLDQPKSAPLYKSSYSGPGGWPAMFKNYLPQPYGFRIEYPIIPNLPSFP